MPNALSKLFHVTVFSAVGLCTAASASPAVDEAPGTFRVYLLGTGSPSPSAERFGSATLVQAGQLFLLFDAGRGVLIRLGEIASGLDSGSALPAGGASAQAALSGRIDKVFLTHLHSDHLTGLPDLWLTGWFFRQASPLRVWGPSGTGSFTGHLSEAFDFDIHVRRTEGARLPASGARIVTTEIDEGVVFDEDGVVVSAFPVDHGPVEPAFGYRIDFNGRTVVISGDTRPSETLVEAAQSADVLIHEVIGVDEALAPDARVQAILAHHTSALQAGQVFAQIKPRLAVFSHVILLGDVKVEELETDARQSYSGPVWTANDLDSIAVGEAIRVFRNRTEMLAVGPRE